VGVWDEVSRIYVCGVWGHLIHQIPLFGFMKFRDEVSYCSMYGSTGHLKDV
jgi:hypothetical protein